MTRPQFAIRDFIWLCIIWALAFGWWLDHARVYKARQPNRELEQKVHELTEELEWRDSREDHLIQSISGHLRPNNLILSHTVDGWELQKNETGASP
jgi:hypothetical protein